MRRATLEEGLLRTRSGWDMFDLGPIELLIIAVLAWYAFHHLIARRWPDYHRAINFAFAFAVVMTLLFGLLARLH